MTHRLATRLILQHQAPLLPQSRLYFSSEARESLIGLVSKLRTETQAPIAKCREALLVTNNDYKSALEHVKLYLLDKGKASLLAGKREDLRVSSLFFALRHNRLSISEIASETDFVSNSAQFVKMGHEASSHLLANTTSITSTTGITDEPNCTVGIEALNEMLFPLFTKYSSIFGEKLQLVDHYSKQLSLDDRKLNYAYYMHQSILLPPPPPPPPPPFGEGEGNLKAVQDCGSMFSFVTFADEFDIDASQLPKQIAQHILANNPDSIGQVDGDGSDMNISTKNSLLNQPFLFDESKLVRQLLGNNEIKFFLIKQKGHPVKLVVK